MTIISKFILNRNEQRLIAYCLPLIALFGVALAPFSCISFSRSHSFEGGFHNLVVADRKGNTFQILPSICNERNKTPKPSTESNKLLQNCFYCLLNHPDGLLPITVSNDSNYIALFNGTNYKDLFFLNLFTRDLQPRGPPWKSSFFVQG